MVSLFFKDQEFNYLNFLSAPFVNHEIRLGYSTKTQGKNHACYSPAERSVLEKTVPEILSTARGRRPRAVLRTEGTIIPNTDRLRLVNDIFIFPFNFTESFPNEPE